MSGRTSGSLPRVSGSGGAAGARPLASRLTGRAVVLMLVLVVLAMSFASSMRAYLEQRAQIGDLKSEIAARKTSIENLEREKRRWSDEAYIRAQARERLEFIMPGETGFQVLDENGKPLHGEESLPQFEDAVRQQPAPWWQGAWESVELAGHPPKPKDDPNRMIGGGQ